jgi:hypothetical protein
MTGIMVTARRWKYCPAIRALFTPSRGNRKVAMRCSKRANHLLELGSASAALPQYQNGEKKRASNSLIRPVVRTESYDDETCTTTDM